MGNMAKNQCQVLGWLTLPAHNTLYILCTYFQHSNSQNKHVPIYTHSCCDGVSELFTYDQTPSPVDVHISCLSVDTKMLAALYILLK